MEIEGLYEELGSNLDPPTFEQILEMDDDEQERDFSKSIVYGFFEQAENTFEEMDNALEKEDLAALSSLGHFLKGSSATLGLIKVRDSCEKIQHFGSGLDASGINQIDEPDVCLNNIRETLESLKEDYAVCERALQSFFSTAVGS